MGAEELERILERSFLTESGKKLAGDVLVQKQQEG
jgi:hypothetical protein